jgi:hypothetical protein
MIHRWISHLLQHKLYYRGLGGLIHANQSLLVSLSVRHLAMRRVFAHTLSSQDTFHRKVVLQRDLCRDESRYTRLLVNCPLLYC